MLADGQRADSDVLAREAPDDGEIKILRAGARFVGLGEALKCEDGVHGLSIGKNDFPLLHDADAVPVLP